MRRERGLRGRAIVNAQREYAMKDRDKNALLEYAQRLVSDPGKKNGLYWEAKQGEPQSLLGPIHDSKVFQKNLGPNTASIAKGMKQYNPDSTWTPVKE